MRYSFEFKMECVKLYRQGRYPETPEGISDRRFHKYISTWSKTEELHGPLALRRNGRNREWSPEEKLELVSKVLVGNSVSGVALNAGINSGLLYSWVSKYRESGYNGLVNKKKGRKGKGADMTKKKETRPDKLTESEREELIRLREEVEYLKTEQAVIKKLEALSKEMEAAELKAKRQQWQEFSSEKDTD